MADGFDNVDEMDLPVGADAVNRLIRENKHLFSDSHCKVCSAVLISESQKLAHYQSKKHASKYRRYLSIHQGDSFTPVKRRADSALDTGDETDRNKCCPVCNMTFSSPVVAASHYLGKTHSKNIRLKSGGVNEGTPLPKKPRLNPPAPEKNTGPIDRSDPQKFCQLCSATFNNPQMSQQHYVGKRHKKQETKSKLMTIYTSCGNDLPQSTPLKPLTPGSASTGNGFTCDTCNIVVNSIEQYEAHVSGAKHKNNVMSKAEPPMDRCSLSGTSCIDTARCPFPRISSSSSDFSSTSFYFSPLNNVNAPSAGTEPVSQRSSGYGSGLLPLSPYASQNYDSKDMAGPQSYHYFSQRY